MEGWIKLHRRIEKHWIWENPKYLRAWMYCLFRANYEETTVLIGQKKVLVPRGAFITSIRKFAIETGISTRETRTFIDRLKSDTVIDTETTQLSTQITICKYDEYQNERHTEKNKATHKATTDKEDKEERKNTPPKSPPRGGVSENKKHEKKYIEFPPEFDNAKFRLIWYDEWIAYRKERNLSRTITAQQRNMNTLYKLSRGSIQLAVQIIRQSIEQNWQGLFTLKGYDGYAPTRAAKRGKYDTEPEEIEIDIRNENK